MALEEHVRAPVPRRLVGGVSCAYVRVTKPINPIDRSGVRPSLLLCHDKQHGPRNVGPQHVNGVRARSGCSAKYVNGPRNGTRPI
jgi:hypothetical protein